MPIDLLRGMDDSNGRENIKRLQDDGGERLEDLPEKV